MKFYEKKYSYKEISEVVSKSTRKKFTHSWVFSIFKRESSITPSEKNVGHNICNVELQTILCNV